MDFGFDVAASCDISTLKPMEQVRNMCAENKCHTYNKNWTCPPNCGASEECAVKIQQYHPGILLQTVGHMAKDIDSRCYRETERRHMEHFKAMAAAIRRKHPDVLCLGAGGCRVCKKCAFPEQAYSSMEGYGLFVTQVCRDNGVPYYHVERTIAYSACILF